MAMGTKNTPRWIRARRSATSRAKSWLAVMSCRSAERLLHEIEGEGRTLAGDAGGDAPALEDVQDAGLDGGAHLLHAGIDRVPVGEKITHRLDRGGDLQRMTVIGARDKGPARRIGVDDGVHIFGLATYHSQRKAIGHRLAIDHQIGLHARQFGIAADSMAETCLHFIENQAGSRTRRTDHAGPRDSLAWSLIHPDILQQGFGDQGGHRIAAADAARTGLNGRCNSPHG